MTHTDGSAFGVTADSVEEPCLDFLLDRAAAAGVMTMAATTQRRRVSVMEVFMLILGCVSVLGGCWVCGCW